MGPSGRGRNKLRLYKTFKQNYIAENFRCGVAPIRIETGRYEGLLEESPYVRLVMFSEMKYKLF